MTAKVTDTLRSFAVRGARRGQRYELIHIWLDHLLVLSMLQHPSGAWRWGKLVVVHPAGNSDFADACSRYRALLVDRSTFTSMTVEAALRRRCHPGPHDHRLPRAYLPG